MGADPMIKPTQIASWDEMGWGELWNNAELFHAEKNPMMLVQKNHNWFVNGDWWWLMVINDG